MGELPGFIHPDAEWVECFICGRIIEDMSRVDGLDISSDESYYPEMVPICADNMHRKEVL